MRKISFLAVALCLCIGALHADVLFQLGNNSQPGEVSVVANSAQTGTTVTGNINGLPGVGVNFTSTQTLLISSVGPAQVSGCAAPCVGPSFTASPINNMSFSLTSPEPGISGYGDLIIDPHIEDGCDTCGGGTATVTVTALTKGGVLEPPATFQYALSSGSNFLTITTTGGERILSTTIKDSADFSDVRSVSLSGIATGITGVPEPSTYAPLLALALGAFALLRRRSRKGVSNTLL